ncbi:hypothetical protein H4R33_001448 [Dimargaris cristalligena]|uniref:Uncharacterized protein n=1 Tax=Dimargaris cristalligena TaxID=215637 RepID=A0A4V1J563_9FUNG|nr:hypothetical protein H4R33_001448 [Dimargaris cristalligena]RKP37959.1 hypothetical protein BJ085DRAFT_31852 [Dimargaris cristalligena]|eukprot:RKP37959.1 hypothetical protein BJ085DRAFT_31852 [Dimargaris cristalligena]
MVSAVPRFMSSTVSSRARRATTPKPPVPKCTRSPRPSNVLKSTKVVTPPAFTNPGSESTLSPTLTPSSTPARTTSPTIHQSKVTPSQHSATDRLTAKPTHAAVELLQRLRMRYRSDLQDTAMERGNNGPWVTALGTIGLSATAERITLLNELSGVNFDLTMSGGHCIAGCIHDQGHCDLAWSPWATNEGKHLQVPFPLARNDFAAKLTAPIVLKGPKTTRDPILCAFYEYGVPVELATRLCQRPLLRAALRYVYDSKFQKVAIPMDFTFYLSFHILEPSLGDAFDLFYHVHDCLGRRPLICRNWSH